MPGDHASDPFLLEILRHRLDSINADAAATLMQVSGSQIAVEANDMNTAILTRGGRVVSCGKSVLVLVVSLHLVVEDILHNYSDNPGIRPGDQFITNDPYVGTIHQPDVVVVAPVFVGSDLVAWTGSCVHHGDVGGPLPGGMNDQATSIYEEAVPLKPLRIVEDGVVRRDIEREFVGRSRRPDLSALDLMGQIAANRTSTDRLVALSERYGVETIIDAMDQILDSTATQFRALVGSLSDGRWRHTSYLEVHRRDPETRDVRTSIYAVRLTMTKVGDRLRLDFGESDDQTDGGINATHAALLNFSIAAVLIHLCTDIPWTAGAIHESVNIEARKGSIVDASWPAPVAMSTAATGQAIRGCVGACIARMLDASADHAGDVLAGCQFAGGGGGVVAGVTADGAPFGTMTLDEISGGGGALADSDGPDSSGFTTSPGGRCANVEVNESYLPMLYLERRELADSGGPGQWRGGVGTTTSWTPHGTPEPISVLSFGQGLLHPQASGAVGGQPGGQSGVAITPMASWTSIPAELPVPAGPMPVSAVDAFTGASQGGGGYGDPLERPVPRIVRDVIDGTVSTEGARRDYGVIIDADGVVDDDATARRRWQVRCDRLGSREPVPPRPTPIIGRRISSTLVAVPVAETPEEETVHCVRCGTALGGAGEPLSPQLALCEVDVGARGGFGGRYPGSNRFAVAHLCCPGCALQLDVQITQKGQELLETVDTAHPRTRRSPQ